MPPPSLKKKNHQSLWLINLLFLITFRRFPMQIPLGTDPQLKIPSAVSMLHLQMPGGAAGCGATRVEREGRARRCRGPISGRALHYTALPAPSALPRVPTAAIPVARKELSRL